MHTQKQTVQAADMIANKYGTLPGTVPFVHVSGCKGWERGGERRNEWEENLKYIKIVLKKGFIKGRVNGYQNTGLVKDKVTIQTKMIKGTQQKKIMSKHIRDIVEIQERDRQERHNGINVSLFLP